MSSNSHFRAGPDTILRRHPVLAYFVLTFAFSWIGALAMVAPNLIRQQPIPKITGILMFPVMLLGPSCAGALLTAIVDGKDGLRSLISRMFRVRVSVRWYAALLIPPILIVGVLALMARFVASVYAPNLFLLGILFGVPAGLFEEIGWTGYAFPKMRSRTDGLSASTAVGLLWSLWHLPVIDYLGTATPHGVYRWPFFLAFTVAMSAMRVLIAWLFTNTNSLLLAQLMHISSTGSLVLFSPPRVTAGQEVTWYAIYGSALWIAVAVVLIVFGRRLTRHVA